MFYKGKSTSTEIKGTSRKILIAFIALVITLVIVALFVNNSISGKLNSLSKLTLNLEYDQAKSQRAILLLHEAEDDFQASLLTADAAKSNDYKTKLSRSFILIDSLLKDNIDTAKLTSAQRAKVRYLYLKKLKLSNSLSVLKHSFDSLLSANSGLNRLSDSINSHIPSIHAQKEKIFKSSDTVKNEARVNKKGLFARIKDAIANKNAGVTNLTVINHNRTKRIIDSVNRATRRDKSLYGQKLQQLQQRNSKLFSTQKQLILLNMNINSELERIVNDVNNINTGIISELKENALKSYKETTALLNRFYLASLFLVLVFATLLIVFIINLNRAEAYLLRENERSVGMAQQKMDLLLHMSHEIRNPLTAINGFLYIFSRSNLSVKQVDMLGSIRLSSDMLLHTLNDTLDAAKMETNEFKINSDPFNADHILRQVIESMEFSAAKKELKLNYVFEGDTEGMILGDSFRLKQIMINLLSNAIKYTKQGGVTVSASLSEINEEHRLQVNITDTGAGISAEQQARLFSKYYQTNSAKGQTGTGLGLYICKQLIQLQHGEINVKSNEGKGSTFSFYIPYKNSSITRGETMTDKLLWKLNGISILAVDNNELGLIFLKMMTSKWNIKFYQAPNAKEALKVITQEPIKIVLIDSQMKDDELITAIKKLKAPADKPPIIVISSEESLSDTEKYLKQGFAGVVIKPFVEAELIKQIVLALGL
ncbi:Signal transduction histidine kinase [Mucilaginibacter pineti]|uniref:histidine kinase n=1 Tax=Mucilaginibacter pineti TaxID=1391627 RepID=A0A1G7C4A0_9SPHI|nr:hybrid sensor histidine kinase/response regulator [Mucilaginibacter pineti]SDE34129.1 Signal transduction histidine kinase [Mucilaginibacter pineti]